MAEDVASSIMSVGVGADEIIEEEVARLSAVDSGAGLGLASGSVEDAPAPAPAPPAAVRSPAKLPGVASTGDREAVKYAEWRRRSEESAAKLLSVHDTNMEEMGPDGKPVSNRYTVIKKGYVQYVWRGGAESKKVPYYYIPDGLMEDPLMLETIMGKMRLSLPNLILHFSAIQLPVESWNHCWNYDRGGDGIVDEDELPFPIPTGTSRDSISIAKYMSQVVKHRVLNIIHGVSQACVQAGALIMVSDHAPGDSLSGLYDYVVPYVTEAAAQNTVVLATYCLKERERLPGDAARKYCDNLWENAGDESAEKASDRPKCFIEDITFDMEVMGLAEPQEMPPGGMPEITHKMLMHHFRDRSHLPSKDLTHMLVFESKESEQKFQDILRIRTPECNFVMNGGSHAMRFFEDSAIKRGTPFFVLQGTGGAADQCALVLSHMKWRKVLDESSQGDDKLKEARQALQHTASWFQFWKWNLREKRGWGSNKIADESNGDVGAVAQGSETVDRLFDMRKKVAARLEAEKRGVDVAHAMMLQLLLQEIEPLLEEAAAYKKYMSDELARTGVTQDDVQQQRVKQVEWKKRSEAVLKYSAHLDRPDVIEAMQSGEDDAGSVSRSAVTKGLGSKGQNKSRSSPHHSTNPKQMYEIFMEMGQEGLQWERQIGMKYEQHIAKVNDGVVELDADLPWGWDMSSEGDVDCESGEHPSKSLVRVPCNLESCKMCNRVKIAARDEARRQAKTGLEWAQAGSKVHLKWIEFWIERNPIEDDPELVAAAGVDKTAEMSRVILSNVWEPPVEDAMVVVDVLCKEMNIEEIMDEVTSAMSAGSGDTAEVGEKTAMRRRLLEAWKLVRILDYNSNYFNRLNHFLQTLVIFFTFLSTTLGVMTSVAYRARAEKEAGLPNPDASSAWMQSLTLDEFDIFQDQILRPINIVLPLTAAFFLAIISKISPSNKYQLLRSAKYYVEGEIFKCRTRTGDYSPISGNNVTASLKIEDGDDAKASKKKEDAVNGLNPRNVLANKMKEVWSDLGSSEIKQAAMIKPVGLEMLDINRVVRVEQHPSLFEEGQVFLTKNKNKIAEMVDEFSYDVYDDGLKPMNADVYIDLRVTEYHRAWEKRAPSLSFKLSTMQFLIFIATTTSTALGSFNLPTYIPIAMSFGGAIGGVVAYQNLEQRLQRVNAALVAVQRLMVWWQGLSVIEKRIPSNKTFLINTMEGIIQLEAGSVAVNSMGRTQTQTRKQNGDEDAREAKSS